jgi:hypothetical protein
MSPLEVPAGSRDPDDRNRERSTTDHGLQSGEDLLVSQVSRGPEEDESIR